MEGILYFRLDRFRCSKDGDKQERISFFVLFEWNSINKLNQELNKDSTKNNNICILENRKALDSGVDGCAVDLCLYFHNKVIDLSTFEEKLWL